MTEFDDTKPTTDADDVPAETEADPLAEIAARLSELTAFATHLAEVKTDQIRDRLNRMFVAAIAWSLVFITIAVLVSVSAVYIARGTALGFSELFGDRPWLGYLLAGTLLLTLTAAAGTIVYQIQSHRRKDELIKKYEARRTRQSAAGLDAQDA